MIAGYAPEKSAALRWVPRSTPQRRRFGTRASIRPRARQGQSALTKAVVLPAHAERDDILYLVGNLREPLLQARCAVQRQVRTNGGIAAGNVEAHADDRHLLGVRGDATDRHHVTLVAIGHQRRALGVARDVIQLRSVLGSCSPKTVTFVFICSDPVRSTVGVNRGFHFWVARFAAMARAGVTSLKTPNARGFRFPLRAERYGGPQ
jgi:hypothetical protein